MKTSYTTSLILQAYRFVSRVRSVVLREKNIRHKNSFSNHWINSGIRYRDSSCQYLMVYAATIGELNAVTPFVAEYRKRFNKDRLIIFVGQNQYMEAFKKLYSDALIFPHPDGEFQLLDETFRFLNPRMTIFAEGPSFHKRFPIWQDLSISAACLYHSVPLYIINACMYELQFHSRTDQLEHFLFKKIHTDAVHYWFTATEKNKSELINAGALESKVVVTGDMKFDTIDRITLSPTSSEQSGILQYFSNLSDPIIVAGSVNAIDELVAVITGWKHIKNIYKNAKLIVAPRYINNPKVMSALYELLEKEEISFSRRSDELSVINNSQVMVIDIFGELRQYFSVSTISYIGRNHGLLEPICFQKPTVVAPDVDWRRDYSAYALYSLMTSEKGVIQLEDKSEMGSIFLRLIDDDNFREEFINKAKEIVSNQKGAVDRIMAHIHE